MFFVEHFVWFPHLLKGDLTLSSVFDIIDLLQYFSLWPKSNYVIKLLSLQLSSSIFHFPHPFIEVKRSVTHSFTLWVPWVLIFGIQDWWQKYLNCQWLQIIFLFIDVNLFWFLQFRLPLTNLISFLFHLPILFIFQFCFFSRFPVNLIIHFHSFTSS